MMAPFTMDELDDLNVFNKEELDRIHIFNKYLMICNGLLIMFLLSIEFINLL